MILKERNGLIMIPKAIFALPPEEKAQALKQLEVEMSQYAHHSKEGDGNDNV